MKRHGVLTLILLVLFSTSYAQTPDKAKLDLFFDQLSDNNKAMGSLIITENNNITYSRIIGYSQVNEKEKIPLTAATRYRIGSITKTFTATITFQLIEEGKLKLDDTIDKFFPQIPHAGKITIQQILAHRSGISNATRGGDSKTNPITEEERLALIVGSKPEFAPDEKYSYSNTGYVLLGYIIEKITEKPYQEVLNERITSKIGLLDTYLGTGYTDVSKNECYSYGYYGRWQQLTETHLSIPAGAGAIISTPADLTKFIQALFDGKLVSKKSLDVMMQKQLGMEAFIHNGKTFYGHAGGIDNFGSWMVYLPEEKLTLAYATNAKVYPVSDIIDGVFDIYWNKPFTIPAFASIAVDPEILDQYIGVYSNLEAPMKFIITRDGTTLCWQQNTDSIPLESTAIDKFKIDPPGIFFEFDATKKQMILKRAGIERVFTKEE